LDSLTHGLALEYACDNVRVNVIAPGVVPVERTAEAFRNPNVVNMWLPHLPTNKLGTVEEVGDATIALLTNEWITSTIWSNDRGMMARSKMPNRPKLPAPKEPVDSISHDVMLVEQP
jgi:glucose 1-dehydrogenase